MTKLETTLAINGGQPAVGAPPQSQPRWGEEERIQLNAMTGQNSLFYWNNVQTNLLVERFRDYYPLTHVMACSSGTAALHIAVAAAGIAPGDEVITTPITDMGTVIGILYQQGVPVFADVDPRTYNLDVADVQRKITPRTRAIVAVHLAGTPCDLDALKALAQERGIILIEDCAQAWGAQYRGRPVGTVGDIGCWSLNDFKHISCGDGGLVASSDERFGPLLQSFGDKAYRRGGGDRWPLMLAPNYRISEPQSAVAAAQMTRMWEITEKRSGAARRLSRELVGTTGIDLPHMDDADRCTAWFYLLRCRPDELGCDNETFVAALRAEGVGCNAGYIKVPIYKFPVFQEHNFFGGRWPVKELGLTDMDYRTVRCPQAEEVLNTAVVISISETMDADYIESVASAVRKVARYYRSL